jgi:hypothetical protein
MLPKIKSNQMEQREKSRGLGDTIEKITTVTGIKKVVETVAKATGKDCGCKARKDALNRAFPYQDKK